MTTLSIGGRYCFCRSSSGPVAWLRIVTIPTPSISQLGGRVYDYYQRRILNGGIFTSLGGRMKRIFIECVHDAVSKRQTMTKTKTHLTLARLPGSLNARRVGVRGLHQSSPSGLGRILNPSYQVRSM